MYSLILLYGSVQFHSLYWFGATDVTTSFKEFHHSQDTLFPDQIADMEFANFQVAFGLTEFNSRGLEQEPIDDPRYGRIVARTDGWGKGVAGKDRNREIPIHRCSNEELGITTRNDKLVLDENRQDSRFYPVLKNSLELLKYGTGKLFCMDEDVQINGDFNTDNAQRV